MVHYRDRIVSDPNVCFGKACIRGTRIWVSLLLDLMADGASDADILSRYPQLEPDDLRAAVGYAAELARETIATVPHAAAE